MGDFNYVVIRNNCSEAKKIYLRFPKPKKQSKKHPNSFTIKANESTHPLPIHFLIGSRGWDKLKATSCIHIKPVPYEPSFIQILNQSIKTLIFTIKPAVEKVKIITSYISIRPGEKSRAVDIRSISQRARLTNLIRKKQASIIHYNDVGPSFRKGNP